MATKRLHADLRDNGLQELIDVATAGNLRLAVCEGDPATYADASSTLRVTDAVTVAVGDLTLQNIGAESGDFAGREVAVAAKSDVNVTTTTGATPDLTVVLYDVLGSRLLVVNEETSNQALTSGNTVNIPTFDVRITSTVS